MRGKILTFLICFIITNSQAQDCLALLLEYKYDEVKECLAEKSDIESESVLRLVNVLKTNGKLFDSINNNKKSLKINALDSLSKGYYILLNDTKRIATPFNLFKNAYDISEEIGDKNLQKISSLGIINTYNYALIQSNEEAELYLKAFKNLIENPIDEFQYLSNKIIYGLRNIQFKVNVDNTDVLKLEKLIQSFPKEHTFWPNFYSIVGTYYESIGSTDKAISYYQNAIIKKPVPEYLKRINFRSYIRLAEIAKRKNNYKAAIHNIEEASNFINEKDSLRSLYYLKNYSSEYYFLNGNYDKAYTALKTSKKLSDALLYEQNALKISSLNVKYQTAEKEKQILIEQEQKKRFRNGVIGLTSILILGSLVFFLIQKNTKRKQLLAVQEKELESQKVTNLLKEQELNAIDAMIEGQEKERQRIANDLHDDLGGLMATVKLHFNALKEKQSPELYKKTTDLLDEAYNKVRSVAHAKNSGVMAKKGLLKALNDMANTVSASNQLHVNILDHGLEERLENSLELTIFRIIQELVTNVIKHAEAKEASIHITKHDESLNIMVEDNGKGFNTKNISKNSGMGIHSIEKRIENLGGNVTIESEIYKGTTIIIDIPFLDAH